MKISLVTRVLAFSLLATTASAQVGYAPAAPAAAVVEGRQIGNTVMPPAKLAPGRYGSSNMLAALARVEPGLYTNNEMIRIDEARRSGDTAALRFYISHDNRTVTGKPEAAPEARPTYTPVRPMGGRGPNG
jgi:hypothetical protein